MNFLIYAIALFSTFSVRADIYLDVGESIRVRGTNIFCGNSAPQTEFYCTINSTFDGAFTGTGSTELEARTDAIRSCENGSRGNGIHCQRNSIQCESTH